MLEWVIVIALVTIGLGMIILEVLFVPGTTFVGLVGLGATIFGIYLGFHYFGSTVGWWFTWGSVIIFTVMLYISFKNKTWDRFSLKESIDSKVNEGLTVNLQVGEEGVALSALKPVGKAEFASGEYEVKTLGSYVDSGSRLKIVKIDTNNILVEPIN